MLKVHAKILNKITILSLQGQFVTGETPMLCKIVQSLSQTNAVILDLARVSKIDAHGLGVMLELRERTHANGIRFELMNVSKPLYTILEMTRLNSVFQITSGAELFSAVSRARRISRLPRVRRRSLAALKSCA
jgi:anti-anti-sigma factor